MVRILLFHSRREVLRPSRTTSDSTPEGPETSPG